MRFYPFLLVVAFLLLVSHASAQKIPVVVGGVAESGYGILDDGSHGAGLNRMTPFMGVWLNGWGYLRFGCGFYNYSRSSDDGERISIKSRDLSAQLAASLGGVGKPYIVGSFTRAKNLSSIGDVAWNEWGVGLGATFQLSTMSAIVSEMEYRWVLSHYDPIQEMTVHGTRLQLNLGFVVYVY